MNSIEFSLAALRFRIDADCRLPSMLPPDEYRLFMQELCAPAPHAVYDVRPAETRQPARTPDGIIWDNGLWRTRHSSSGDTIDVDIHDVQVSAWRRSATLARDFSSGTLWISQPPADARSIRPLYHPQDRAVILGRLCHLGGVMMHASSVRIDGRILIFAGMSGAGKTTIARLWRAHGGILLNDERTLIHAGSGQTLAGASPWHGEENQVDPAVGPVAGIFFLNQAARNQLRPLPLSKSLPRMMTTAFVPVFIPDGPALTLAACHTILEAAPTFLMDFTPDSRALDLCRQVLATPAP